MKGIKRYFLLSLILLIVIIITLEFGAKVCYKKEELKYYIERINNSKEFPKELYSINDKLFQDRELNIRQALMNSLGGHKNRTSYDFMTAKIIDSAMSKNLFPKLLLAFYLNRKAGVHKCYDFYTNSQFDYCRKVDSTFNKIENLTDTLTILKFFAVKDAPRLYINHPERTINKISYLKRELMK